MSELRVRTLLFCYTSAFLAVMAAGARASELPGSIQIDLPAGDLDDSLREYARQTDQQILFSPELTSGKKTAALHGSFPPAAALDKLLEPSGLKYQVTGNVIVVFRPAPPTPPADFNETIVVTGIQASIETSLTIKRSLVATSDTLLADDISKVPDQNLADTFQEMPGAAVSRTAGEGRQVAVRGLGAQFTQVRINGMETLATTGSSSTSITNRGRAFDFNVFASDIFDQLTVLKSSSADTEEGSLGVTIDIHTGRPFDRPNPFFGASVSLGYNDLAKTANPRVALAGSHLFLGGRLGVLISAAYGDRRSMEQGYSTIRYINDNTGANIGQFTPLVAGCSANPALSSQCSLSQRVGGVVVTGPLPGTDPSQVTGTIETAGSSGGLPNNYDAFNEAFRARFPRYDLDFTRRQRLGLTASVQGQIDDATLITLDTLYTDYHVTRDEYYLGNNTFANPYTAASLGGSGSPASLGTGNVLVTDYTIDPGTQTVTKLTGNGFGYRDESFYTEIDSRFEQVTLEASRTLPHNLKLHALAGWSESHMRDPRQIVVAYDFNGGPNGTGATDFSYDFSGGYEKMPSLYFGGATDANGAITDLSGWYLSEIRELSEYVFNAYRTSSVDFEWDMSHQLTLKGGAEFKNYGFHTIELSRSNGTPALLDYSIPADLLQTDLPAYSKSVALRGSGAPAGSTTAFNAPDIPAWSRAFSLADPAVYGGAFKLGPEPMLDSNGTVHERDAGYWLELEGSTAVLGIPIHGDIGTRIVHTAMRSTGYSFDPDKMALDQHTAELNSTTILPSSSVVAHLSDTSIVRLNLARTMTHAGQTSVLPGTSVVLLGSNRYVFIGNPYLKPITSENVDLAYEWYYQKDAMISFAWFYKDIDRVNQTIAKSLVFDGNPYGLPNSLVRIACGNTYGPACNENQLWSFTTPVNAPGRPLYGTEISWRQPFQFLPSPLDNMGVVGGLTYAQAEQTYRNSDGSVFTRADLVGLSRLSGDLVLYYDAGPIDIQLSTVFRSKYTDGISPGNLNDQIITASRLSMEVSANYRLDKRLTLTFSASNLTGAVDNQYIGAVARRPFNLHQTGRDMTVSLRYAD